jgi:uncharacterized protein YlxW (UPF0749 family)
MKVWWYSLERKKIIHFTVITTIIGFMLAVQFQTTKQPVVRDTRDMWELREDLKKEQELQGRLIEEIRTYEEKLQSYQQQRDESKEEILRETVEELKREAGLTEVRGQGVIITIEPFYSENYEGPVVHTVSPYLLKRLINELNMYGAKEIAIGDQRIINTTVIRDVNGVTKIDKYKLNSLPIQIKVIADDAEKLHTRLKASTVLEDFIIEDLQLIISEPMNIIVLPAYDDLLRIRYMQSVKAEKEEK